VADNEGVALVRCGHMCCSDLRQLLQHWGPEFSGLSLRLPNISEKSYIFVER
jgi:hypothetical protein